jgi:hypothetical protein
MKNSTAFILILISATTFYTWILPQYSAVQTLRGEQSQYTNILANVSALSQKRDQLLTQYRVMPQTDVDRLAKILPDNASTVELAQGLDAIASHYGIALKGVDVVTGAQSSSATVVAPSNQAYGSLIVSTSFITTYQNFRQFENDMEHSLRITDVQSLQFSVPQTGNLYDFQMTLQTYWLKNSSTTSP